MQPVQYAIDTKPRPWTQCLLAMQFIYKFALLLVLPVVLAKTLQLNQSQTASLLSTVLLLSGIASMAFANTRLGGGYFLPVQASIPYFALVLYIGKNYGLAAIMPLVCLAAIFQFFFAWVLPRWHGQLLREMVAVMLMMLGIWAGMLGVDELYHPGSLGNIFVHGSMFAYQHLDIAASVPGIVTLLIVVALFFTRKHRLHAILYAMLAGSVIGWLLHTVPTSHGHYTNAVTWLAWPHLLLIMHWQWHWSMLVPAILVGFIASMQTLTLTYVMHHRCEQQPDQSRQRRALFLSALTTLVSSVAVMPVSIIPGSVGDSYISNAFSRYTGYWYGVMMLVLACMPKLALLLLLIPASVNGAAIIAMGAMMVLQAWHLLRVMTLPAMRSKVFGVVIILAIGTLTVESLATWINGHLPWLTNPAEALALVLAGVLLVLLYVRGGLYD